MTEPAPAETLRRLAGEVRKLSPEHGNPEAFVIARESVEAALRRLARELEDHDKTRVRR